MAKSDKELLVQAIADEKMAAEAWDSSYKAANDDLNFVYDVDGGQWPEEISKERKGRPMITINKLLKFVRKLRGETRINRPRIKVIPVDNEADLESAELYNGIIRQIEYHSNAEVAYDTAYQSAISCGIGFFRIITEYEDELSFDQTIKIKRIPNFASVLIDPRYVEFDASDMKFAFIMDHLTNDEYEATYPKADKIDWKDTSLVSGDKTRWFENKKVKIAEYFYKDTEERTIGVVEMPGREGGTHTGIMELNKDVRAEIEANNGKILKERETKVTLVKWCKLSGMEVLEKQEWPGKYIPIVPMFGDEIFVKGERHLLSLIRGAKEPQRMYNYWCSAATEAVALVPKSPFIIPAKSIEGYEGEWEESNVKNRMYLRYKPIPGLPVPQRQPQAQIPNGMVMMMQNASIEIEDHLGQYEASKGAPSNERSGAAIAERTKQSDKGTFTFVDNETRSVAFCGRQLIDLIPKVFDRPRAISILGEDGAQKTTVVNENTGQLDVQGNPIVSNDLSVGKHDLIATVGASYASRREEAAADMKEVMQYSPDLSSLIAPLYFKYSDWPGSQEIYADLKKAIDQQQQLAAQQGGVPQ